MSEYKLTEGIIALSESSHWDYAKLEWKLDEIYEADERGTCLCGHYPIIKLWVGVHCVSLCSYFFENGEITLEMV